LFRGAASVRAKRTVNSRVSPGARVIDGGVTCVVIPAGPLTLAWTARLLPLTFVRRRSTVWLPAMSPIAIEAPFRSLGSVE